MSGCIVGHLCCLEYDDDCLCDKAKVKKQKEIRGQTKFFRISKKKKLYMYFIVIN